MFRVAGKVPGGVMTERWHLGTWLGKRFHTEEHIVARKGDRLVWCIFICHLHLTSIICCTAVWAQACGLERKTSFVIIVHLWFIRRPRSFFTYCWCVGGSSITILPLLVQIFRTFAIVTFFVLCVMVNTLPYHDPVDFVQDPETEDPQLVAEPSVGRNHGKTM